MQRSNRPVMALVAASNRYEAQIVRDILVRTGIMRIVEAASEGLSEAERQTM